MRAIELLVLLSLICIASGRHAVKSDYRNGKIIGGHDAPPRSHPYIVSLQMRLLWARFRLCSASVLSERWILTAAHCVTGSWLLNWLTMEAVVGTDNLEQKASTAQTVVIAERIPHPDYDGGIGAYDIAMLKTAKSIEYNRAVAPIEVPYSMGSQHPKNLMLAGWGVLETTLFIPALSDKLQEAKVEYVPFDECYKAIDAIKESFEENPLDRNANICTGPLTGGVAACSGDSGGPLIQFISYDESEPTTTELTESWNDSENEIDSNYTETSTDNKLNQEPAGTNIVEHYKNQGLIPVVIGVVSWGITPCGEVGAPTVYTNVSSYANFIHKHLYN